jgi:predicted Zn-ribbon and HTH transcriptional regulator
MKVELQIVNCKRCGYSWTPRKTEVMTCPKCRSPYWNRERQVRNSTPEDQLIQNVRAGDVETEG